MPTTSTGSATSSRARLAAAPGAPRLGNWELVGLVAEGAVCRVYAARPAGCDHSQPAGYALKTLRCPWDVDPRGQAMLAREAQVGAAVCHPRVAPVLAANLAEAPCYVVMPLLEGRPLREHLDRGPLPLALAFWIARQTAEGLEALHAVGYLHGDVKPSNVLVAPSGHVTLVDLGLCRRIDEPATLASRPVVGTFDYMSPEMLTTAQPLTARSDLYSLGVTLYEMLAGRLPFAAARPGAVTACLREAPRPVRSLRPHAPLEAQQLLQALLAKEPLRRPQSAREVIDALALLEIAAFNDREAA